VFPYPIDGDKAKTRIARKSLWIEVTAPAASSLVSGGYDSQPFPVIINEYNQPSSWSLPRIDLSKQPAISPMDSNAWLADSFDQFVSVREKKLIDLGHPRTPDFRSLLPFFKKTLLQISMHVADEMKVFVLAGVNERADVFDTLIVASCLRHGRETGTVILDAWVVPVPLSERINFILLMPRKPGKCTVYQLQEQETAIWKHMLPAAVECCEYLETGKIPLSTAPWKSHICSCGEGKDVEDFPSSLRQKIQTFCYTSCNSNALGCFLCRSYGSEGDLFLLISGDTREPYLSGCRGRNCRILLVVHVTGSMDIQGFGQKKDDCWSLTLE